MIDIARAEAIPGYMHAHELLWLARHAAEAMTVIEIGSFAGRSTRALADHCRGVVYAVDTWDGSIDREPTDRAAAVMSSIGGDEVYANFCRNLGDLIGSGRVVPWRCSSREAAHRFQEGRVRADLVFIDADHRYASCLSDIKAFRQIVKPGGILAGHDYRMRRHPGVTHAVDETIGAGQIAVERHIWWTRIERKD